MTIAAAPDITLERTVFEYGVVSLTQLPEFQKREVLLGVEQLPKPGGQEVIRLVVREGKVALQATQHVGLYQLGPLRLQVLPKIHKLTANSQEAKRQAMQNLFVMLRYALDIPLHTAQLTELEEGTDWFEALTTLFTESLLMEWQRGPIRRYESVEEDLTTIRGRLRVQDHIRRVGRQHVLPVEYDEFTTDTALNRLFRYVVSRLLNLSRSARNLDNLRLLAAWMDEDGIPLLPALHGQEVARLSLDRLNLRYEIPFTLARLFIQDAGLNAHVGDYRAQSLFFDMNALFEGFLTGILLQHRAEILPDVFQDARLVVQGEGNSRPLLIRESTGHSTLRMKPDVMLQVGANVAIILDFKYKVLDPGKPRAGIGREDLYQMFAYAQRYHCANVMLLYPGVPGLNTSTLRYRVPEDGGHPARLLVATVDLNHNFAQQGISSVIHDLRIALEGTTV
ncbi:McrC family protein [Deinococcus sp. KNUC1210]|uniref:McrC family protein n=1 Tax=Deinococcus sp. KNUC1210 TaxID=2917691 RepID=UPI001EF15DBE|nr:McrC family protein [Deinococcus sp. KNUC1210]ULH14471.1 McrC family protein [Deinococcus sp. KNUC1210]